MIYETLEILKDQGAGYPELEQSETNALVFKNVAKIDDLEIHTVKDKVIPEVAKAKETAPNTERYEPFFELHQTENLSFLAYTTDSLFENYSTLAATSQLPRYCSNRKPASETISFPFIDVENTTTPISNFTISKTTFKTVSDGLSAKEKIGLFGMISLYMQADTSTRNILNGNDTLKNFPSQFKIQLKNRSAVWRYINATSNALIQTTDPTRLPLVPGMCHFQK